LVTAKCFIREHIIDKVMGHKKTRFTCLVKIIPLTYQTMSGGSDYFA